MPTKFNPENINALDENYKTQCKEKLNLAIDGYLEWMNLNIIGHRFRFSHFFHSPSGAERVTTLRAFLLNPHQSFYNIVEYLAQVTRESGTSKHSFNRYLYQHVLGIQIIDTGDRVNDDFYQKLEDHWSTELSQNKPLNEYSLLALTKGVSKVYEVLEAENRIYDARARAAVGRF